MAGPVAGPMANRYDINGRALNGADLRLLDHSLAG